MRKKFFKDPTLYEGTLNDQNLLPDDFELESNEVIYQLELLLLKEGLLIYSDIKYVNKYIHTLAQFRTIIQNLDQSMYVKVRGLENWEKPLNWVQNFKLVSK